jgi:hypothetical protein
MPLVHQDPVEQRQRLLVVRLRLARREAHTRLGLLEGSLTRIVRMVGFERRISDLGMNRLAGEGTEGQQHRSNTPAGDHGERCSS